MAESEWEDFILFEGEPAVPIILTGDGAPYDSASLCAGYAIGSVWARLEAGDNTRPDEVPRDVIPQLDLIAMHFGFVMGVGDLDPENPDPFMAIVWFDRAPEEI